jgi:hypothetical protein
MDRNMKARVGVKTTRNSAISEDHRLAKAATQGMLIQESQAARARN